MDLTLLLAFVSLVRESRVCLELRVEKFTPNRVAARSLPHVLIGQEDQGTRKHKDYSELST